MPVDMKGLEISYEGRSVLCNLACRRSSRLTVHLRSHVGWNSVQQCSSHSHVSSASILSARQGLRPSFQFPGEDVYAFLADSYYDVRTDGWQPGTSCMRQRFQKSAVIYNIHVHCELPRSISRQIRKIPTIRLEDKTMKVLDRS